MGLEEVQPVVRSTEKVSDGANAEATKRCMDDLFLV